MTDEGQHPIIVKRIRKSAGGGHGGAWKIAYADFVTAMMAFFLLMWLLGSTAQGDLEGIADYFQNPIKVSMAGGDGTGDSSSVIPGGGEDLTRSVGQVKRGDLDAKSTFTLDAAGGKRKSDVELDAERRERARLIDLKGRLDAIIEASATLRQFKNQILIDITSEGLRIQLVDEQNRPMFQASSAELRPYTRELLREIARALNDVDHRISLSGHTDASQYAGGERGFSNWELSANRANAARRELVGGGLEAGKMIRVVGLADTIPLLRDDPFAAVNRRISIIVLNKTTEEAIRSQSSTAVSEPEQGASHQEQEQAPGGASLQTLPGLPDPALPKERPGVARLSLR